MESIGTGNSENYQALMLILELLQVALGVRNTLSRTPSRTEWEELFSTAKGHVIIGLCFAGIEKLPKEQLPGKDLLIQWFGLATLHKNQKRTYDAVMAEFATLLHQAKIRFVVFKGLAAAAKYPVPALRTMGDIDFYVPPADFRRAVEYIEANLCKIEEKDCIDKHFAFTWKGIRFEMHYQMETFGYDRHQSYYNQWIDDAIAKDIHFFDVQATQVPMLPPEADLVHVFKHWMNHLIGEGIGLRQTTDIAVLTGAYRQSIDIETLKLHLSRIGYLRAFDAAVLLVEKYYAIPWPEYWEERYMTASLPRNVASRFADKLMKDILENGNFGRSAYKYKTGLAKRLETSFRFFSHCIRYYRLAPKDILYKIPKQIAISLKAH